MNRKAIILLCCAHFAAVIALPSIGASVFVAFSVASGQSLDVVGAFVSVIASLFFLVIPSAIAVVLTTPLFYLIARIGNRIIAVAASCILGGLVGALFGMRFVVPGGISSFTQVMTLCSVITGMTGGIFLEESWRMLWLNRGRFPLGTDGL